MRYVMVPKLKKDSKSNGEGALGFIDVIRIYPSTDDYVSMINLSSLSVVESEEFKLALANLLPFNRKLALLMKLYNAPEETVSTSSLLPVSDCLSVQLLNEIQLGSYCKHSTRFKFVLLEELVEALCTQPLPQGKSEFENLLQMVLRMKHFAKKQNKAIIGWTAHAKLTRSLKDLIETLVKRIMGSSHL